MTPERWQQIDKLLDEALDQESKERRAFLEQACAGDAELYKEVEALLAAHEKAGSFMGAPALEVAARVTEGTAEESMIGRRLGACQVLSLLGKGGMGEVYLAHDSRLDRQVALKVLPVEVTRDLERLKRFVREARAASVLNHPNIATIYELGEAEGVHFILMEHVQGETLAERIHGQDLPSPDEHALAPDRGRGSRGEGARPALTTTEILDITLQVADALEAAHSKGIIHRDIKPANIMLTPQGQVKVLDFGLAKRIYKPAGTAATAAVTESETTPGVIMGTVDYMSPEQILGQEVDQRTDLFSLGVVLYNLATGRLPFRGVSPTDTIAKILHTQPEAMAQFNEGVPEELERIVRKCLEKDRDLRYQHATDLCTDLKRLRSGSDAGRFTAVAGKDAGRGTAARRWKWIITVVAAAAILAIVGYWYFLPRAPALTEKDTIVLSDFVNKTGDSVFDDTLKQGLSVQLEQSPFLKLLSDRKANETLKLMGRPANDQLTPEVTREVCERTGSTAMLTGSIAALGNQYVIGLKAVSCVTGDLLAEAQEQAAGKEGVLKALDAAAVRLRRKLGESLSSVEKHAAPLQEVTTTSLEALKSYSMGRRMALTRGYSEALPFYQRAVDLDPNFARAYSSMAGLYGVFGKPDREAECARKAWDLREKVSERERFHIEMNHYGVLGDLEKQAQTCVLWQQAYPSDSLPNMMLGEISIRLGDWERALEEYREALRLEPENWVNYLNLGATYVSLNRLDEAEVVFKQSEEGRQRGGFPWFRYWEAFLKGDTGQMAWLVSDAKELLLGLQADTESWHGKLKNARELTGRAIESAWRNDAKEAASAIQVVAALREVESGNRQQARTEANAALKLAPNRYVRARLALALARAGDTAGAEKLAAEIDKTFPFDTILHRYWLPTIRAAVALERKDPNRAIELLKVASDIELGLVTNGFEPMISLCPPYLRGEAYLMLRDGNRAAAEFQKFVDHRGLVMNFLWGALARLELARALALQGDIAKAHSAYQDFFTLWKDADPDLPLLKQAKAEYSRLK